MLFRALGFASDRAGQFRQYGVRLTLNDIAAAAT